MRTLHIFNPDTDYALSCTSPVYTPPASVVRMRRALALIAALYARDGDIILCLDRFGSTVDSSPFNRLISLKNLTIITSQDLSSQSLRNEIGEDKIEISPWGWNNSLLRLLAGSPLADKLTLPDAEYIETVRNLAHRRNTIRFMELMRERGFSDADMPIEFLTVDEAMDFYYHNVFCFFKSPWSSSGRGIIFTGDLEPRHIKPWLSGIIKSQKSVLAEKAFRKSKDFASEWICDNGSVNFTGFSLFEASRRGKYHHNLISSQENIRSYLNKYTAVDIDRLIDTQKECLELLVPRSYFGPIGIDMMIDDEGKINPCVEINVRNTMGMVAGKVAEAILIGPAEIAGILRSLFPDNRLTFDKDRIH